MIIKPTGTIDFFPKDTQKLQYIEDTAKKVAAKFGFGEIRIPTFEFTELFARVSVLEVPYNTELDATVSED